MLMIFPTTQAQFYNDHAKGWHWYEPQQIPVDPSQQEEPKKPKNETKEKTSHKPKTPVQIVASYRQELENRLAKAWIDPTPQNIRSYQEMQKDMTDRSKVFSDVWMQSIFQDPALDHTIVSPVNQKARHVQLDLEKKKLQQTIQEISKEYGLFFFFSGNCSYCHEFSPIVKQFSNQYGWSVLAISVDGGKNETFPNAISDNGLFQQWNVKVIPSLYAVNPNTGHVIPLANGMTSIDQIETRLLMLLKENK